MAKISREAAEVEFDGWLDARGFGETKREKLIEVKASIVDAIMMGKLSVTPANELTFTFEPIMTEQGAVVLDKLTFSPRLRKFDRDKALDGISPTDGEARIDALIPVLTQQKAQIIAKLDVLDYDVCASIAAYFF